MLGALYTAKVAKIAGIVVLIVVGAILVLIGICLIVNYRKQRRLEELGITSDGDNYKVLNKTDEVTNY